ncbi:tetratricopeptide repeat protein [Campylobacter sp. MG1]|uniref:tetratricopeptide repeat protein n=1 Tax=Campylobacter sp. MG1 TaxID=2976332 RepID=UPI00226C6D7A|nr:tetratricopeptide repeat protein [Campylobacter sp. MG1]
MKKLFFILSIGSLLCADDLTNYVNNKLMQSGGKNMTLEQKIRWHTQNMIDMSNQDYYDENAEFENYRYACEKKNNIDACNKAGVILYNQKSYKNALTWFEYTCSKKNGTGCNNAGDTCFEMKQYKKANAYYQKAINLGNISGYHNLAWSFANGLGKKVNNKRARELYTYACNKNYNTSCNNLGWFYLDGVGVAKNKKVAKRYFTKACNLKHNGACETLRNNF